RMGARDLCLQLLRQRQTENPAADLPRRPPPGVLAVRLPCFRQPFGDPVAEAGCVHGVEEGVGRDGVPGRDGQAEVFQAGEIGTLATDRSVAHHSSNPNRRAISMARITSKAMMYMPA